MSEIQFVEQPRKWEGSVVSALKMKLLTFEPEFEQTRAKLRRHCLKMAVFRILKGLEKKINFSIFD